MKFVDEIEIVVASGKGGPGSVSFRRETLIPRGGPDGGDGGKGGDVIFVTDEGIHSLLDLRFQRKYKAEDGEKGMGQNRSGADGKDLILKVPKGTLVKDENGHIIVDLAHLNQWTFLKGGIGGKGNTFYKSSVNQAPTVAQKGMPGEEKTISLELKLLADVGLVGLPNAGKSTLISRISAARPKIADYPFTTLVPNLGVVRYGEEQSFVVADIPGIIEGAHKGVGLGTQFLRHIERTKVFVHLIDASNFSGKDPYEAYLEIQGELKAHDEQKFEEEGFFPLLSRPQIVVLNKVDVISESDLKLLQKRFLKEGIETMAISAVAGKNINELVFKLGKKVFGHE